ncbi:MAG: hypothetical protein ACOC7S_01600 [Planctomycetota bacterium]
MGKFQRWLNHCLRGWRLAWICNVIYLAGNTCTSCGSRCWDGFKAIEKCKRRYGEAALRRHCVDLVFHSSEDAGAGDPGVGVDLAYRMLSKLADEELLDEMLAIREDLQTLFPLKGERQQVRLRRLDKLIAVVCQKHSRPRPSGIPEPTFEDRMDVFPEVWYG